MNAIQTTWTFQQAVDAVAQVDPALLARILVRANMVHAALDDWDSETIELVVAELASLNRAVSLPEYMVGENDGWKQIAVDAGYFTAEQVGLPDPDEDED